uniref:Tetratricopeptide repeat protein n=1 Tax=Chromera velia CCMP2878 TaxID=1169474 RepID=A0A0G4HJ69_9ALVE|eukprot:Cvel_1077.t1-p1 / transcript=Cvel_1077.t1 / gene=Cvel_1077 / organism=Chromera_velia_CCMP2878 / gene_product=hypothetical protein / transcript_product=hypothetical protein / location=Cvel_scaffold35:38783-39931(+) / protein_length=383 / sequence_SO=supercontig / SO=protein_coding / is_pseudo=false
MQVERSYRETGAVTPEDAAALLAFALNFELGQTEARNYEEDLERHEEMIRLFVFLFGERHRLVSEARDSRVFCKYLYAMGLEEENKLDEAVLCYKEFLEMSLRAKELTGAGCLQLAANDIARILEEEGRLKEAEKECVEILQMYENIPEDETRETDSPRPPCRERLVGGMLCRVAHVLEKQGKDEDAMERYKEALIHYKKLREWYREMGPRYRGQIVGDYCFDFRNHGDCFDCRNHVETGKIGDPILKIAELLEKQNKFAEAMQKDEGARGGCKGKCKDREFCDILAEMARLLRRHGKFGEAREECEGRLKELKCFFESFLHVECVRHQKVAAVLAKTAEVLIEGGGTVTGLAGSAGACRHSRDYIAAYRVTGYMPGCRGFFY